MLKYFSFLSFVKSNELCSKHCTFLRDAELPKALGNCQLNVHDELSIPSSYCILASNFLASISHCPWIQNVPLSSLGSVKNSNPTEMCPKCLSWTFPASHLMAGKSLMTGVSWLFLQRFSVHRNISAKCNILMAGSWLNGICSRTRENIFKS